MPQGGRPKTKAKATECLKRPRGRPKTKAKVWKCLKPAASDPETRRKGPPRGRPKTQAKATECLKRPRGRPKTTAKPAASDPETRRTGPPRGRPKTQAKARKCLMPAASDPEPSRTGEQHAWQERAQRAEQQLDQAAQRHDHAEQRHRAELDEAEQRRRADEHQIRELIAQVESNKAKGEAFDMVSKTWKAALSTIPACRPWTASMPIKIEYETPWGKTIGDRRPPPTSQQRLPPTPPAKAETACTAQLSRPSEQLAKEVVEKNDVSLEAVESVLKLIEVPFNSNRPNVIPKGHTAVRGMCFGLCDSRGHLRISKGTKRHPWLTKLFVAAMRNHDAEFQFTGIYVNQDYAALPHVDRKSWGPSYIVGLGEYTGGELWVHDDEGDEPLTLDHNVSPKYSAGAKFRGRVVDVRYRWTSFDTAQLHYTRPFTGKRYTLVYFTCDRLARVPQDTRQALSEAGIDFPWDSPDLERDIQKPDELAEPRLAKRPRTDDAPANPPGGPGLGCSGAPCRDSRALR